ncbi:hypothetical protein KFE25_001111 [Diacronema lutheri]|uniref:Carbohydrate kinase FGGY C-terminal domain-containing protein n=1 Tax=Diacronema lutheri TaxID=2081491 RepID=A0A8J5XI58_DIALT|nr:hypothetical protein KFE25_001111 [Diacronema lutheri]
MVPVFLAAASASRAPHARLLGAGFDFGTSGVRVAVLEPSRSSSEPVFSSSVALAPDAGAHEWLGALDALLGELPAELRARLTHIGISGTSATCVLTERDSPAAADGGGAAGELLGARPSLRGTRRYDWSAHSVPAVGARALELIRRHAPAGHTACAPTSSLAKLVCWQLEQPLPRGAMLCHQADYLSAALLDRAVTPTSDWHNALKLGFDVSDGALRYPDWLLALLRELGPVADPLGADALPTVVRPGEPLGAVSRAAAARWGLSAQCIVCAGTTDSIAAFLAATGGACSAGTAVTSLGSTIAIKLLSQSRADDAAFGLYSHRLGNRWLVGGASNAGCAVLREHFSDAELTALSERIDADAECDLGYVPLRASAVGERFPTPSADARQRLEPRPTSATHADPEAAFLHAILDALARVEARGYTLLAERGADAPHTILTCGGGSANVAFTRIRSRLLPVPAERAKTVEASVGVALLALSEGDVGGAGPSPSVTWPIGDFSSDS